MACEKKISCCHQGPEDGPVLPLCRVISLPLCSPGTLAAYAPVSQALTGGSGQLHKAVGTREEKRRTRCLEEGEKLQENLHA